MLKDMRNSMPDAQIIVASQLPRGTGIDDPLLRYVWPNQYTLPIIALNSAIQVSSTPNWFQYCLRLMLECLSIHCVYTWESKTCGWHQANHPCLLGSFSSDGTARSIGIDDVQILQQFTKVEPWAHYVDCGDQFLSVTSGIGAIRSELMPDALYPSTMGMEALVSCLAPVVHKLVSGQVQMNAAPMGAPAPFPEGSADYPSSSGPQGKAPPKLMALFRRTCRNDPSCDDARITCLRVVLKVTDCDHIPNFSGISSLS